MRYNKLVWLLLPAALMASCANNAESYVKSADSVVVSNDLSDINSPSRKIIHTADIRCRVSDVYKSVDTLERMVNELGGMIAESHMENSTTSVRSVRFSADSLKQVTGYTTTAHLTLRIPNFFLDTVIRKVPALATFIDTRTMQRQDVTLKYLANAMKNQAAGIAPPAIADKKNGGVKENKAVSSPAALGNDTVINRRIENLQILDDVNYATLKVDLYQPEKLDVQIVADTDRAASIPFGSRLLLALGDGWQMMKGLVIVLLTAWPLWLLVGIALYVFIIMRRRKLLFFAK